MKKYLLLALLYSSVGSANAQWSIDSLSDARLSPAVAVTGDKVYFVGGDKGTFIPLPSGAVEEFDLAAGTKSTHTIPARTSPGVAMAGTKLIVASGLQGLSTYYLFADLLNTTTGTWSSVLFKGPRTPGASASVGTKALFAGGRDQNGLLSRVDIYDDAAGVWSSALLSKAREKITPVTVNRSVVFAGGYAVVNTTTLSFVRTVDIYNDSTGLWSTALMSTARGLFTGANIGDKVTLAGGVNNRSLAVRNVDIYDNSTGSWSTALLSQARYQPCAAVCGGKLYLAGGYRDAAHTPSARIDIYNPTTNAWSTLNMPVAAANLSALVDGNNIYFSGAVTATGFATDSVYVLNTISRTWSILRLSAARSFMGVARTSHHFLFGGGAATTTGGYSKRVDILNLAGLRVGGELQTSTFNPIAGPNPFAAELHILGVEELKTFDAVVYDNQGRTLKSFAGWNSGTPLPLADLPAGIYLLQMQAVTGETKSLRVVKYE